MKKMRSLAVCLSFIFAFSLIPAISASANITSGNAVYAAQYLLLNAGKSPGTIDGAYGTNTQNAIVAFQKAKSLAADGVIGVNTWAALTSGITLSSGSSGNAVYALQRLLLNAGYSPGTIDGAFGTNSKNAVIAFQGAKGLTKDGIVGPNTWNALTAGLVVGTAIAPTPAPTPTPTPAPTYGVKYTNLAGMQTYANNNWNSSADNDCAPFVCKCLNAGGIIIPDKFYSDSQGGGSAKSWCPSQLKWLAEQGNIILLNYSLVIKDSGMYSFFTNKSNATYKSIQYTDIDVGDVVFFDSTGNEAYNGIPGHVVIIVGKDTTGMPLFAAHSNPHINCPLSYIPNAGMEAVVKIPH